MKGLIQFLNEAADPEKSITNEKEFREFAKKKFEKVFGDDLDEKRMKSVIDGLINDNSDSVKNGEWGKLIGMLNKSFG